MYKVEVLGEIEKLIKPFHTFVYEILDFVKQEPKFSEKNDSDLATLVNEIMKRKKEKTSHYKFLDIATRTKLKKYICDLKYEKIDLLSKYIDITTNYEEFLSGDWKDSTQYSENLTLAFEYFYTDLIQSQVFNNAFNTQDAIKKFREEFTLESTCPYCDCHEMEFDLASVDHFIPKSKYPLLSIFPKNLVVACSACNDRIKKANLYLPIMHPYFDNLDDFFHFLYKNELIKIEFQVGVSPKEQEKVVNFFKLFNLEERYNKRGKNKLFKLKTDIRRSVVKQFKRSKNVTSDEIKQGIIDEIWDSYKNISLYKRKDALTKLRLDYLNQISKEDLSDVVSYIVDELEGNRSLEHRDLSLT